MTKSFTDSECFMDRELVHHTDILKNHIVDYGCMTDATNCVLDFSAITLSSQLDYVVVNNPVLDCCAARIDTGMNLGASSATMLRGIDSGTLAISPDSIFVDSSIPLTVNGDLNTVAVNAGMDNVVLNSLANPILQCGEVVIDSGVNLSASSATMLPGIDSDRLAIGAGTDLCTIMRSMDELKDDILQINETTNHLLSSQILTSSDLVIEEEASAGLQQRPDELSRLWLDSLVTVSSRKCDLLNVDIGALRENHPKAIKKWESAVLFFDGIVEESDLSVIGHLCREAIQEFAEDLYSGDAVYPVEHPKARTLNRMAVSLLRIKSKSVREFLNDRWKGLGDLVQRLEHSALKEGEAIESEDAILVLFETIVVFCELDSRLPESKAHLN